MRKETPKEKVVRYGSIYAEWKNNGVATRNASTPKNTANKTVPKVDIVNYYACQKVKKNIYAKFVASATDHEIECIINPFMYSKTLPKMNSGASHQLVIDRIRIGCMRPTYDCVNVYSNYHATTESHLNNGFCYICDKSGMIYDTFCVYYRGYHEHVSLCITCGGFLESKGNVLYDKIGKIGYDKFIQKLLCVKMYAPQDVVGLIMQYSYMLFDKVLIKK